MAQLMKRPIRALNWITARLLLLPWLILYLFPILSAWAANSFTFSMTSLFFSPTPYNFWALWCVPCRSLLYGRTRLYNRDGNSLTQAILTHVLTLSDILSFIIGSGLEIFGFRKRVVVATPRRLRDEKSQNGTLVRSSQCIRETFTGCLPVNTNDTARTGNQDEMKHNGCQTTRLNTQRWNPERRFRRGLPQFGIHEHTKYTHN
jgi:thiol-disulfide isomerase/thioredoxin